MGQLVPAAPLVGGGARYFIISMISSEICVLVLAASSASSMLSAPNSFSMIAIFLPCVAVRMWLSSVVLPLPRKPVSTVTGTRLSSPLISSSSLSLSPAPPSLAGRIYPWLF